MTKTNEGLTIFFPFYNDAGTVELMIADAFNYGSKLTNDLEVIAIEDHSTDNTLEKLREMKNKYPKLKLIVHQENKGYGGVVKDGIKNSTKAWVFYTDGDAQYHLDELESFWKIKDGFDVVNGYKFSRNDNLLRQIAGSSYRILTKFIFKTPIHDVDCDYRLMRGDLVRSLDLKYNSGAITIELAKKLGLKGARFKEIGVNHYTRIYGTSTFFTFARIWETIKDEWKLIKKLRSTKV